MSGTKEHISHKDILTQDDKPMLHSSTGGLIYENETNVSTYKHPNHRFRQNGRSRLDVYTSDVVRLPYSSEYSNTVSTLETCREYLFLLSHGIRPETSTLGIEVETTVIENNELAKNIYMRLKDVLVNIRPELMESTLEVATDKVDGHFPKTPVELANALGTTLTDAVNAVENIGCKLTISSSPEVYGKQRNTNHPYLNQFAPIVKADAIKHKGNIPQETIDALELLDQNIDEILNEQNQVLQWPDLGTHIHLGLPKNKEGKVDPRIALITTHLRLSPFANVIRASLSSSKFLYGRQYDGKDVRSITRRILNTTHDTNYPNNYTEYYWNAVTKVVSGEAPDISRFSGGHDRARLTPKETGEDIGAPNSDPRSQLAFALSQEIMQTIAVEALELNGGDERQTLQYLDKKYDGLMTALPSIGENSDHEWWVKFNKNGYNDEEIQDHKTRSLEIIKEIGNKFNILTTNSLIVSTLIEQSAEPPINSNLSERFGIKNGTYDRSIKPTGFISDYKSGKNPTDLIDIQHNAIKLQAEKLKDIKSEKELLEFYGITTL